jgi:integrase
MVDYSSFTDARVNRVKLNEKLRDAIASLSVTRLARGNKIVFRWQKRIKNSKAYPTLTLGSYPSLTINEARRIALEYDGLAEKGIHPRDKEEEERKTDEKLSVTLREALDRYTMWRAEKNSQGTIKHRHDSISLIFADYMDKPIRLLTVEVVNDIYHYWKSQRVAPNRKNKNGSPYSAKNGVKYLNSIFNYCVIFKILDENPILPILKPLGIFEKPKSRGIYLQPKECERLILGLADLRDWDYPTRSLMKHPNYRESWRSYHSLVGYHLLEVLLWTGLRVGDVARLKWEDVFMKGNEEEKTPHFTLKIQKNQDRPFAVPLTNSMRRIFSYMQKMKLNSPYVFPRIKDTTAMPYTEIFKNKKGEDKAGKWMINSKKQLKKRYKRVHELRIDKTNGFGSLKRVCENIQMYSFPKGFKDKKTKKMIPQLLRHNFATHGRMCGLTNEQLQMITGHSNSFDDRQMGNALLNYVRNLVVVNNPLFERVEEGMHGDLYKEIIL